MLTVDVNKRIEWQVLFSHPILRLIQDQLKKQLDQTMKESEDIQFNASKFYLKANMVVDHPHEIEKNENINRNTYEVVCKKKNQEEISKKDS